MPEQVTAYRIFLATPGGLEPERRKFREIVDEVNQIAALERGVLFVPVGWEETLAGFGRPQALINEDLNRCDYFMMILHDRWGSPPDLQGRHSSGTEEEYALALQRRQDPIRPMRNIVVFFKEVEVDRLKDPGPQLQKVMDFRDQLEKDKLLLFDKYEAMKSSNQS